MGAGAANTTTQLRFNVLHLKLWTHNCTAHTSGGFLSGAEVGLAAEAGAVEVTRGESCHWCRNRDRSRGLR